MSNNAARTPGSQSRATAENWSTLVAEVNDYGCAPTRPPLAPGECREFIAPHDEAERCRATIAAA